MVGNRVLRSIVAVVAVVAVVTACAGDPSDDSAQSGTPSGTCERPATEIQFPGTITGTLTPVRDAYPGIFFCVVVPSGTANIVIELRGLEADLDLFVGDKGLDLVPGHEAFDHQWSSRQAGSTPERIEISDPAPGIYYIEVHSVAREESAFVLSVEG